VSAELLGVAMPWEANLVTGFKRRVGKSALELGETEHSQGCPDIWEMDNGDFVVIGRDVTASYAYRLPADVTLRSDERVTMLPRSMMIAAKPDIPDA
jgi:hypothetical protein